MAGTEVIYFLFSAQLTPQLLFRTLISPEPVAECPPLLSRTCVGRPGRTSDRFNIRVSRNFNQLPDCGIPAAQERRFKCKKRICTKQFF
jgi:hypothetical protein